MLSKNDALALSRALKQMPPLNIPTSPLIRAIATKADPQALLALLGMLDESILGQVMKVDPQSVPEFTSKLIHASELDKLAPIEWLRRGEIPAQGLTVIYGPSGAGKSFLALDYALQIAQAAPVVYVAAEGERGYKQRVQAWVKHHKQGVGQLYIYPDAVSLANENELTAFISEIGSIGPVMVVVDTVAQTLTGFDENSARDMGLYLKACKQLKNALGLAVVLVHHTNKGGIEERGSGALRGAADSMLRLTREDDVLVLEVSKSKDSRPMGVRYLMELELELGTDHEGEKLSSLVLVPADKKERQADDPLSNNQQKVLRLLADPLSEDGLTYAEMIELASIPKTTLYNVLSALFGMELIEKRGKSYAITDTGRSRLG